MSVLSTRRGVSCSEIAIGIKPDRTEQRRERGDQPGVRERRPARGRDQQLARELETEQQQEIRKRVGAALEQREREQRGGRKGVRVAFLAAPKAEHEPGRERERQERRVSAGTVPRDATAQTPGDARERRRDRPRSVLGACEPVRTEQRRGHVQQQEQLHRRARCRARRTARTAAHTAATRGCRGCSRRRSGTDPTAAIHRTATARRTRPPSCGGSSASRRSRSRSGRANAGYHCTAASSSAKPSVAPRSARARDPRAEPARDKAARARFRVRCPPALMSNAALSARRRRSRRCGLRSPRPPPASRTSR